MGFLDFFKPKTKSIGDWSTGSSIELIRGSTGWRGRRSVQEVLAAYTVSPWFRAVVGRASYAAAVVPWQLFATRPTRRRRDGPTWERHVTLQMGGSLEVRDQILTKLDAQGRLVEITDHPLLDLMAVPNPALTGVDVRLITFALLFVAGECGWAMELNNTGKPTVIWPVPPTWIIRVPSQESANYVVQVGGKRFDYTPEEFILFREPTLINPYGRGSGLGVALSDELENDEHISKFQNAFFHSNGRPDLLVVVKPAPGGKGTSSDNLKVAKEEFENKYRGPGQGRSMWTRGEISIQEISQKLVDLDLTEQRTWLKDLVRQVIGAPPEIMGDLSSSNRATITAAIAIMAIMSTVPQLEKFRAQLQHHFVPMFDERLALGYVSPIPADKEFQLKALQVAPYASTRGEIRKLQGQEDRGEPDNIHIQPMGLAEVAGPPLPRERIRRSYEELLEASGWSPEGKKELGPILYDVLTESDARARGKKCTCSYGESGEMTRHAPLCALLTKAVTPADVDQIVNALDPQVLDFHITPEVEKTIEIWGNKTLAEVGVAPNFNMLNPLVGGYIDEFSGEKIVGIDETTQDLVKLTLDEGILEGEGADDLARRLRAQFSDFSVVRSVAIARTEVNNAANFSTWAAHKMSGVVDRRGWSAAFDGRGAGRPVLHTDFHALDPVGIDEPFVIGEFSAMYPGGFGVASMDIQCRCSTYAVITDPKTGAVMVIKSMVGETDEDQKRVIVATQNAFAQQLEDVLAELRKVA